MMTWWNEMMKKIYDWCMSLVSGKWALPVLCVISFIESSFFPIPPDLFLIPLILTCRTKAFKIALYTTLSSVLGGFFGYAIGYFLYDVIGVPILEFYNAVSQFETFKSYYNNYGSWIVFGAGLTPFPYKIVTIASGVTGLNLIVFGIASFLARGIRFFLIAWLLWKWGEPMKTYIEKNLGWLSVLFFVLLVGGFLLLKVF